MEAKSVDFVNTFAMANQSGKIAGVVSKNYPSICQAYFLKGFPEAVAKGLGIGQLLADVGQGKEDDLEDFLIVSLIVEIPAQAF